MFRGLRNYVSKIGTAIQRARLWLTATRVLFLSVSLFVVTILWCLLDAGLPYTTWLGVQSVMSPVYGDLSRLILEEYPLTVVRTRVAFALVVLWFSTGAFSVDVALRIVSGRRQSQNDWPSIRRATAVGIGFLGSLGMAVFVGPLAMDWGQSIRCRALARRVAEVSPFLASGDLENPVVTRSLGNVRRASSRPDVVAHSKRGHHLSVADGFGPLIWIHPEGRIVVFMLCSPSRRGIERGIVWRRDGSDVADETWLQEHGVRRPEQLRDGEVVQCVEMKAGSY